ncbi:protein ripply3 [Rhinatrema bivittatum]|uniref:protein ripply3 n=1 Tax=Rhinatrema bivittatum TaxID=194408 RepID=UPI00112CB348|nr:protein ripply3 [Rhinatrema bivittatum]
MESAPCSLQAPICPCCAQRICNTHLQQPGQPDSDPTIWRPWTLTARDAEVERRQRPSVPDDDQGSIRPKGALGFQHPVRLYMPRSKCHEYLHQMGEKALAGFPVQATIHFYNDDSDSEDEDDEAEFCSSQNQDSDSSITSAEERVFGTRDQDDLQTAECLEGDSAAGPEAACMPAAIKEQRTNLHLPSAAAAAATESPDCPGLVTPGTKHRCQLCGCLSIPNIEQTPSLCLRKGKSC